MKKQAGFTLMEVMVVVAIIAVLAVLAIVYLKPKTKPVDVSMRVGEMVREASREAVSYGTIRPDVGLALTLKARTRVVATSGPQPTFSLQRFIENASPATTGTWTTMMTYTVPSQVTSNAFASSVGPYSSVTLITTWSTFAVNCYPDGTCDPATLFFSQTNGNAAQMDYQSRMSIMPLGASIYVRKDWN